MKDFLKKIFKSLAFDLGLVLLFVLGVGIYILFVGPETVAAQSYQPLAPIPGFTPGTGEQALGQYINSLYRLSIGLGAVLAVLMIVVGGLQYMTTDNFGTKGAGRTRIQQALMGLGLLLASFIILNTINPELLDLNVELTTATSTAVLDTEGLVINYLDENNITGVEAQLIKETYGGYSRFSVASEQCSDAYGSGAGWTTTARDSCRISGLTIGDGQYCCGFDQNNVFNSRSSDTQQGWYYDVQIREFVYLEDKEVIVRDVQGPFDNPIECSRDRESLPENPKRISTGGCYEHKTF